jgi:predicted acylesterase/phospholipase RssA
MVGVVNEIDRVGRGTYGLLLDLLTATARPDMIAGASAGGINGAALALGQP